MRKETILLGLMLLSMAAVRPAPACSTAGPDVHIGRVATVDGEAGEFTIKDFETGKFITFQASENLILKLRSANATVAVKYQADGSALTALEIQ